MTTTVQPVAPEPADGHTHPTPGWLRVAFLVFAVGMAAVLAMGGYLYNLNSVTVARQAAQLDQRTKALAAELNAEQNARDAQQAKQQAATSRAVCIVLQADLPQTRSVIALADRLGCVLPTIHAPAKK